MRSKKLKDEKKQKIIIKYKKKVVIVKKGETFSKILDNFNFEKKKKFEIINSINQIFDLRGLNVNQKIIFLFK